MMISSSVRKLGLAGIASLLLVSGLATPALTAQAAEGGTITLIQSPALGSLSSLGGVSGYVTSQSGGDTNSWLSDQGIDPAASGPITNTTIPDGAQGTITVSNGTVSLGSNASGVNVGYLVGDAKGTDTISTSLSNLAMAPGHEDDAYQLSTTEFLTWLNGTTWKGTFSMTGISTFSFTVTWSLTGVTVTPSPVTVMSLALSAQLQTGINNAIATPGVLKLSELAAAGQAYTWSNSSNAPYSFAYSVGQGLVPGGTVSVDLPGVVSGSWLNDLNIDNAQTSGVLASIPLNAWLPEDAVSSMSSLDGFSQFAGATTTSDMASVIIGDLVNQGAFNTWASDATASEVQTVLDGITSADLGYTMQPLDAASKARIASNTPAVMNMFIKDGFPALFAQAISADISVNASLDPGTVTSLVPTGVTYTAPITQPSESPSVSPSDSQSPTMTPTESQSPTQLPTEPPTTVPSQTPTTLPSQTPTTVPSQTPTSVPTETPTTAPSQTPTTAPSETPTTQPSSPCTGDLCVATPIATGGTLTMDPVSVNPAGSTVATATIVNAFGGPVPGVDVTFQIGGNAQFTDGSNAVAPLTDADGQTQIMISAANTADCDNPGFDVYASITVDGQTIQLTNSPVHVSVVPPNNSCGVPVAPPQVNLANATIIAGDAIPGATVQVISAAGVMLGSSLVDMTGYWSVPTPAGTPSQQITANEVSPTGAQAGTSAWLDTDLPASARIDRANTQEVAGNLGAVESSATVTVIFPDGSMVKALANADGSYSVATPDGMVLGTVTVIVTDTAGNSSGPVTANLVTYVPPTSKVTVTVKNAQVAVGGQQTVTGKGFKSLERVTAQLCSTTSTTCTTVGTGLALLTGQVSITFTVPDTITTLGAYTVTLTGPTSGTGSATFQVIAPAVPPVTKGCAYLLWWAKWWWLLA